MGERPAMMPALHDPGRDPERDDDADRRSEERQRSRPCRARRDSRRRSGVADGGAVRLEGGVASSTAEEREGTGAIAAKAFGHLDDATSRKARPNEEASGYRSAAFNARAFWSTGSSAPTSTPNDFGVGRVGSKTASVASASEPIAGEPIRSSTKRRASACTSVQSPVRA